ncbi:hypothetical protein BJX62DRAFT_220981 [Aspergillus germanicus]
MVPGQLQGFAFACLICHFSSDSTCLVGLLASSLSRPESTFQGSIQVSRTKCFVCVFEIDTLYTYQWIPRKH